MEVNLVRSAIVGGIAMSISLLLALFSYYQGDKMVLAVSGAKPLEHKDDRPALQRRGGNGPADGQHHLVPLVIGEQRQQQRNTHGDAAHDGGFAPGSPPW